MGPIIGDKDCSFKDIVFTILKDEELLYSKIPLLALSLGIRRSEIAEIQKGLLFNMKDTAEVLFDILISWRSQRGNSATLASLLDVLETRCGLKKTADALREKFTTQKGDIEDEKYEHVGELKYCYTNVIGHGPSSVVYRGAMDTGLIAAVKKTFTSHRKLYRSKLTLENYRHILELFKDISIGEGVVFMAMELGSSNLRDLAKSSTGIRRENIVTILKGVSGGLNWLHGKNIVHGNLKPENVIIFQTSEGVVSKLSDFWLSRESTDKEWLSPQEDEAGNSYECTKTDDIFSMGLIFYWAMSRGEYPFKSSSRAGDWITFPKLLGPEHSANNIISWMLHLGYRHRPTSSQVVSHPFFWSSEKCLDFFSDLDTIIDRTDNDSIKQFSEQVDEAYQSYFDSIYQVSFHWPSKVDERLFQNTPYDDIDMDNILKQINANSIFSLVNFIHKTYQKFDTTFDIWSFNELFDIDVECTKKEFQKVYVDYFLERFPDIVIILFCSLIRFVRSQSKFKQFEGKYIAEYRICKDSDWADHVISKYMSHLDTLTKSGQTNYFLNDNV